MDLKTTIKNVASSRLKFKTADVLKELHGEYSRQYVSSVINVMVKEKILVKGGSTSSAFYTLFKNASVLRDKFTLRIKNQNLLNKEDKIYNKLENQTPLLGDLKENVSSTLFYAFTEMLNNAIEHSKSKYIEIEILRDKKNFTFIVNDYGIGVFKNVMHKRNLKSELEAMQDLLKGKTTTQPLAHSGEGIFFTSKAGDTFLLESFGYRLRVDNIVKDVFFEELKPQKRGTKVIFTIALDCDRHFKDLFRQFVTEGEIGFDKTEIKVHLFTMGSIYISRSQARRLLVDLDKYKSIVLDFDKVPTVGQAFADEIFRVFKQRHPDIKITPINMVEPVQFMIDRVNTPDNPSTQ